MATITSATTGNFSAGGTWVGGVVPGPADIAVAANGTVVTIDTDVTVTEFQQAGTGKFTLGNGRTITGLVRGNAGTIATGGTIEFVATTSATIIGDIRGSITTDTTVAVLVSSTGTLNITGSIYNGGGAARRGLYVNAISVVNITGTILATVGTNGDAVVVNQASTINVVGNIQTGVNSGTGFTLCGIRSLSVSPPTINVTGDLITGSQNSGGGAGFASPILSSGVPIICSVIGNATGGSGTLGRNNAIYSDHTQTQVSVIGNVTAGVGADAFGIWTTGAGSSITVNGTITAVGTLTHGVRCDATANGVIFEGNLTDSLQGATAIYSRLLRVTATNTGTTTYTNTVGYPNGTPVTRVSPDLVTGMPSTSNVRQGTIYGYNNELTGTVAIPPAGSVALGAEVDTTTGTAALDAGTVIAVVGQQVAAASSSPSVV